VTASSEVVYSMSADWSEISFLDGRDFIADTREPSRSWLDKYIHPDDQARVLAALIRHPVEKEPDGRRNLTGTALRQALRHGNCIVTFERHA
jgi:hypothetical protein